MLTIFTVVREFTGLFDVLQRNAIGSWQRLEGAHILLFAGSKKLPRATRQAAADLGVTLAPVECNPYGTPLITAAIERAKSLAKHDILCMANSDNIYLSELRPAVRFIAEQFEQFLVVGQRWNLKMTGVEFSAHGRTYALPDAVEVLTFQDGWESDLRVRALAQNDVEHVGAVDYLIWRGDFFKGLPPLAVGQKGYDSLLVWLAYTQDVPVIDVTRAVMVIHQDHPATFTNRETALNGWFITRQYGDKVRGGVSHSSHRLYSDRLVNRETLEEIAWKR